MAISHIVIAMKPLDGNFVENALKHGVAGINIDGCRIGTEQRTYKGSGESEQRYSDGRAGLTDGRGKDMAITVSGRFPANIILGHSEGCINKGTKKVKGHKGYPNGAKGWGFHGGVGGREIDGSRDGESIAGHAGEDGKEEIDDWQCVENCPVRVLGEQSGESVSRASMDVMDRPNFKNKLYGTGMCGTVSAKNQHNDAGTAARFFKQVSEFQEEK